MRSSEQHMANRILMTAGVAPPEIGLRKGIAALWAQLETLEGAERERARRERGLLASGWRK